MEGESKVSPKEGETVRKTLPFHQATRERRKEGGERGGEGLRACVRVCACWPTHLSKIRMPKKSVSCENLNSMASSTIHPQHIARMFSLMKSRGRCACEWRKR